MRLLLLLLPPLVRSCLLPYDPPPFPSFPLCDPKVVIKPIPTTIATQLRWKHCAGCLQKTTANEQVLCELCGVSFCGGETVGRGLAMATLLHHGTHGTVPAPTRRAPPPPPTLRAVPGQELRDPHEGLPEQEIPRQVRPPQSSSDAPARRRPANPNPTHPFPSNWSGGYHAPFPPSRAPLTNAPYLRRSFPTALGKRTRCGLSAGISRRATTPTASSYVPTRNSRTSRRRTSSRIVRGAP